MVYSESSSPSGAHARLDDVFAALGHPARREIVRYLATRPSTPRMHAVATDHEMSPQLLNKHVAVLERSGLVTRKGRGRHRYLELDVNALDAARQWIDETRTFWEHQLDGLAHYVTELTSRDDESNTQDKGPGA